MEYRLRQKDFHVLPKEDWKSKGPFQLISALNLLDRFFDPDMLLADIHEVALRDGAQVLLGVVLPLSQYVEFHPAGRGNTRAGKFFGFLESNFCFFAQVYVLCKESCYFGYDFDDV